MPGVQKAAAILVILTVLTLAMVYGAPLLIPLAIAIIIWYLIVGLAQMIKTVSIGGWHTPGWLAGILSPLLVIFFVAVVVNQVSGSVGAFVAQADVYSENLRNMISGIEESFGVDFMSEWETVVSGIDLSQTLSRAALEFARSPAASA